MKSSRRQSVEAGVRAGALVLAVATVVRPVAAERTPVRPWQQHRIRLEESALVADRPGSALAQVEGMLVRKRDNLLCGRSQGCETSSSWSSSSSSSETNEAGAVDVAETTYTKGTIPLPIFQC